MTDVLLAHAFYLAHDAKQRQKMRPYPPLGTLYAASHLRERGYTVALFDAMFASGPEAFEATLDRHRPRLVALYEDTFHFLNKMCLAHAREAACRMAEMATARGIPVIGSGADVSDQPRAYFEHGVGYALVGEAEHSLGELVDVLSERDEASRSDRLDAIDGLVRPDPSQSDGLRRNRPRQPERRPDTFPLPAWDLVDEAPYRQAWTQAHGYFSLNMVTTRGCPFHCNWCAKPIWGQRYAMRSPADVAREMAHLKATFVPDHLWFADDIFGLQPKWVAAFADEVEARDAKIPFMMQTRVDLMTPKAVTGLARAGCAEVWMGVESGSQKILDAMHKGTKLAQLPAVRQRLREAGIRTCFFLQFGYPGEDFDDVMATVDMVRATLPDDIGISVSYPLPGTRFHDMVRTQLGDKQHWRESNDLAMMFQGTYDSAFYRHLHGLVHRDLELHQALAEPEADPAVLRRDLARLATDWRELGRLEVTCRNASPTTIGAVPAPRAPDLRRTYN